MAACSESLWCRRWQHFMFRLVDMEIFYPEKHEKISKIHQKRNICFGEMCGCGQRTMGIKLQLIVAWPADHIVKKTSLQCPSNVAILWNWENLMDKTVKQIGIVCTVVGDCLFVCVDKHTARAVFSSPHPLRRLSTTNFFEIFYLSVNSTSIIFIIFSVQPHTSEYAPVDSCRHHWESLAQKNGKKFHKVHGNARARLNEVVRTFSFN